jgi:hypothetical protein
MNRIDQGSRVDIPYQEDPPEVVRVRTKKIMFHAEPILRLAASSDLHGRLMVSRSRYHWDLGLGLVLRRRTSSVLLVTDGRVINPTIVGYGEHLAVLLY